MNSWNLLVSILASCLLMAGSVGLVPAAKAVSASQVFMKPGEDVKNSIVEIKRRGRSLKIYTPIAPNYLYYDYPYYYSRGFYPTHIKPGFIYYGHPYDYYTREYSNSGYDGVHNSAKERCARRFRSFEWDTGRYTTYGGHKKLCPYLR